MEIQKQFLRKGRDYNRSGAQLRPKMIGLYELKDNLPNMLASNVVSHQDEGITTVFHTGSIKMLSQVQFSQGLAVSEHSLHPGPHFSHRGGVKPFPQRQ